MRGEGNGEGRGGKGREGEGRGFIQFSKNLGGAGESKVVVNSLIETFPY